jgi:hypothetical protein
MGSRDGSDDGRQIRGELLTAALAYFRSKFGDQLDSVIRDMGWESSEDNGRRDSAASVSDFWEGLREDLNTEITIDTKFERFETPSIKSGATTQSAIHRRVK